MDERSRPASPVVSRAAKAVRSRMLKATVGQPPGLTPAKLGRHQPCPETLRVRAQVVTDVPTLLAEQFMQNLWQAGRSDRGSR
jgi:hypothetical protein